MGKNNQQTRSDIWTIKRTKYSSGNCTQVGRPWEGGEGGEDPPSWLSRQALITNAHPTKISENGLRLFEKTHGKGGWMPCTTWPD